MTTVDGTDTRTPTTSPITQAEINHLKGFLWAVVPLFIATCVGIYFVSPLAAILTTASALFTIALTVGVAYAAYLTDRRTGTPRP